MARKKSPKKTTASATSPLPRVQVTGVVVYLQYPDGTTRAVTYDPRHVEALFWSRRAVTEILGRTTPIKTSPWTGSTVSGVSGRPALGRSWGISRVSGSHPTF
jgi:hypothetical protein